MSTAAAADSERLLRPAASLLQAERLAEAEALLDRLAPSCGERADFFRLRALAAVRRNDGKRAFECFTRAAGLAPDKAVHHFDLGEHQRLAGQLEAAIRHYRQGLALDPSAAAVRITLAGLLAKAGRRGDALQELARATAADAKPPALVAAALAYRQLDEANAAIRCLRRARDLRPDEFGTQALLRDLYTSQVRPWHFRMMNDAARNQAYDQAIRRAVGPTTQVLEIGTGSGLLSLMAARAGARWVTTCEQVEVIAETAAEIVRANGYGDRIKVIAKRSTSLTIGVDLPERADLLVSEILSDALLGESVLPSTAHARQHLLKPGAAMIPRAVAVVVRLVGGDWLSQTTSVGRVAGFDLTPFNRFAPSSISISMESGQLESYSADLEVFRFDLTAGGQRPEQRRFTIVPTRSGRCVGLLQWLRLQLDDSIVLENAPTETVQPSAWRQALYPFPQPIDLDAGESIELRGGHDLLNLAFAPLQT